MHRKITADVELAYPSSQTENHDKGVCFGSAGWEAWDLHARQNFAEFSLGYRMFLLS